MSLDVYLNGPSITEDVTCRECNHTRPVAYSPQLYSANITHNLGGMAGEAGLYEALWRPDEVGLETAGDLIGILKLGLHNLTKDAEKYRALNPANGWGNYEGLVKFVTEYLAACREHPTATVRVSR